jgi:hypothetical protein
LEAFPEWAAAEGEGGEGGAGATRRRGAVRRVAAAALTYDDFFAHHLCANEPVHVDGVAEHWRASAEWTRAGGEPDVEFLAKHFDALVQVRPLLREKER